MCMDASSRPYYEAAKDVKPNLLPFIKVALFGLVKSVIPYFTNPNNATVATGATSDANVFMGIFIGTPNLKKKS